MPTLRWCHALELAVLGVVILGFTLPITVAFLGAIPPSLRRSNAIGGETYGSVTQVARKRSTLRAIKRKFEALEQNLSGKVVGGGGVMGALSNDVDALMETIEKNKKKTAEAEAAGQAGQDGGEGPGDKDGDGGNDDGSADEGGNGQET